MAVTKTHPIKSTLKVAIYEELLDRCEVATTSVAQLKTARRNAGRKIDEPVLKMKHVATYRQLKLIYDRYKASEDKEKFLLGHESQIILFETTDREYKRLGVVPFPMTERIKTELASLTEESGQFLVEYETARNQVREYETIKQTVDRLCYISQKKKL